MLWKDFYALLMTSFTLGFHVGPVYNSANRLSDRKFQSSLTFEAFPKDLVMTATVANHGLFCDDKSVFICYALLIPIEGDSSSTKLWFLAMSCHGHCREILNSLCDIKTTEVFKAMPEQRCHLMS
jgi:hypothetical protein